MDEAKIKIVPRDITGDFGARLSRSSSGTDSDIKNVIVSFFTPTEEVKILCTPEWALKTAHNLKKYAEECLAAQEPPTN